MKYLICILTSLATVILVYGQTTSNPSGAPFFSASTVKEITFNVTYSSTLKYVIISSYMLPLLLLLPFLVFLICLNCSSFIAKIDVITEVLLVTLIFIGLKSPIISVKSALL